MTDLHVNVAHELDDLRKLPLVRFGRVVQLLKLINLEAENLLGLFGVLDRAADGVGDEVEGEGDEHVQL